MIDWFRWHAFICNSQRPKSFTIIAASKVFISLISKSPDGMLTTRFFLVVIKSIVFMKFFVSLTSYCRSQQNWWNDLHNVINKSILWTWRVGKATMRTLKKPLYQIDKPDQIIYPSEKLSPVRFYDKCSQISFIFSESCMGGCSSVPFGKKRCVTLLPECLYEIGDIENYIEHLFPKVASVFSLKPKNNTLNCEICNNQHSVDFH